MRFKARMQQKKRWQIKSAHPKAKEFAGKLKVSPLTANILLNRDITSQSDGLVFLNPKLAELSKPETMAGVEQAVERIAKAIHQKEKITIYGDYDVDGITSTTILLRLFRMFDAEVDFYIPHRIDEGYGLNSEALIQIADNGTKLVITVDCGINSIDEVEFAKSRGMDIIITDHHRPSEELPKADAVVHPMLNDPDNSCAGAMVAFKLAWAVANKFKNGQKVDDQTRQFLIDATMFAAMGTVADVIDLTGENRIITSFGLAQLDKSKLPGIQALIEAAGLTGKKLDSFHIGFGLAPMLNAAGRMGHARLAVELLTSESDANSFRIANYLKEQNIKRRKHEREIFKDVCAIISTLGLDHPDRKSIVLSSDNWHQGVIGIVASRVVDKFGRPTILINTSNGQGCGSGRSVKGFSIFNAVSASSQHLVRFGGHDMAIGVTIETAKINEFAEAVEEYTKSNLTDQDGTAELEIDALCRIGDFNHHIVRELGMLGPFGKGNPKPIFASRGVRLVGKLRKMGSRGDHLSLALADNSGTIRAVGFNMAGLEKKIVESEFFNIAYEPQINSFNGNDSVEFILTDIQFE